MNTLLSKYNIETRKNRPLDSGKEIITVYKHGNLMQLTFRTIGCRFSMLGSCSMCNYGKGEQINPIKALLELEEICKSNEFLNSKMILLGASGSFLDEYEIPKELQYDIMRYISKSHIEEVFIETHYKTISEDILQNIKKIFGEKVVHIEMGLETTTKNYQNNILNKEISLYDLSKTIEIIHQYTMNVSLNILLGLPFLTLKEQINDTKKSIDWAMQNFVDYIVVFPINFQPYTLFKWWYSNGYAKQTSPWLLVELLKSLSDEELPHICLAWYGNRSISYDSEQFTIIPFSCTECQDKLISFFSDFTTNYDLNYRKKILNDFITTSFSCNCKTKFLESINNEKNLEFNIDNVNKSFKNWSGIRATK